MLNLGLREGIQLHRPHTTVHHVGEQTSRSYQHQPLPKYLKLRYSDAEASQIKIKIERERHKTRRQRITKVEQNTVLDDINWGDIGTDIDEEHLAHLDFADDVIMMAHAPQELDKMLNDIHTTSNPPVRDPAYGNIVYR